MSIEIDKTVYLIGLGAGSVIRAAYSRGLKRARAVKEVRAPLDTLLLLLASAGLLVLPLIYVFTPWLRFADYERPGWLVYLGAIVFAGALWLLFRSHADLGENWSPTLRIVEGQSLVTGGVYSRIRHPMYAAHLIWGVAQALLLANWIAGPSLIVFCIPLYITRVGREEEMLCERFGDKYRRYMMSTGRIIPRITRQTNGPGGLGKEG